MILYLSVPPVFQPFLVAPDCDPHLAAAEHRCTTDTSCPCQGFPLCYGRFFLIAAFCLLSPLRFPRPPNRSPRRSASHRRRPTGPSKIKPTSNQNTSVHAPPLGDGLHLRAAVLGRPRLRVVPPARHLPPSRRARRPRPGRRRRRRAGAARGRRRPRGRGRRRRRQPRWARAARASEREHAPQNETCSWWGDGGNVNESNPGGRARSGVRRAADGGPGGGKALARHLNRKRVELIA